MGESEYRDALQREAAWLDEQLAHYVAAQIPVTTSTDDGADPVIVDVPVKLRTDDVRGLGFEDASRLGEGIPQSEFADAEPRQAPRSDLGVAQPPQIPMWRKKLSDSLRSPTVSLFLLFLVLITSAFAIWQTMQSKTYKRQADQAAENVQKWGDAQIELDNLLCSAGYPTVVNALKAKVSAKAELSSSEKALLAFGTYRTETPNISGTPYRVDAVPACPKLDENGVAVPTDGQGSVVREAAAPERSASTQ